MAEEPGEKEWEVPDTAPRGGVIQGWEDVARIGRALRREGLGGTIRKVLTEARERFLYVYDRRYDKRLGIDTYEFVHLDDLSVDSSNKDFGVDYEGSPGLIFRLIIESLPRDLSDFTFVDYGSGKGRVLFLAARHNFKSILGVEFSRDLHAVASRNVEKLKETNRALDRIELVNVDATEFEPPDGNCVLYFFHPFEEPVMRKVVSRIRASFEANPRTIYLVYLLAEHKIIIEELGFLRRIRFSSLLCRVLSPYEIVIYRSES